MTSTSGPHSAWPHKIFLICSPTISSDYCINSYNCLHLFLQKTVLTYFIENQKTCQDLPHLLATVSVKPTWLSLPHSLSASGCCGREQPHSVKDHWSPHPPLAASSFPTFSRTCPGDTLSALTISTSFSLLAHSHQHPNILINKEGICKLIAMS